MVLLEKANVYNGISMETIIIFVMVSIGVLLFFLAGIYLFGSDRQHKLIELPSDF